MRTLIGLSARLVFWVCVVLIVVDAVSELWRREDFALAVAAAILFPITVFVWPLAELEGDIVGLTLWWLLVVAIVAYPVSTFIGGLSPIDRPGDV